MKINLGSAILVVCAIIIALALVWLGYCAITGTSPLPENIDVMNEIRDEICRDPANSDICKQGDANVNGVFDIMKNGNK